MPSTINADNGVVSGSAGLKSAADSSGVLSLQTNGTTAVTVDTSQNVGIGTTSPAARLEISQPQGTVLRITNTTAAGTTGNAAYTTLNCPSGNSGNFFRCHVATADNGATYDWGIGNFGTTTKDVLAFYSGGLTERMRIDSSGNLLVGTTGGTGRLRVVGSDSTSSNFAVNFYNSSSTVLFYIRNDGVVATGTAANSPYNLTTGNAANVYVDSAGVLYRSTSSLKYKTDVQDATHGLADVLKLRPVTYKGKNDGDKVFGGLIAEEVHEAGLTEFVQYAEDGSPDALHYGNMVSLCIKALQELKAEVDSLKSQLAAKG